MGILFLGIAVCFINVALWVVMLTRFKKLFTADNIIAEYQKELHSMTDDIDRHANRTISIIEDAEKELRALIAEAERRIVVAKSELEKQEQSKALLQKIQAKSAHSQSRNRMSASQRAAQSYALTTSGQKQALSQGSLFDTESDKPAAASDMMKPNQFTVDHTGASYASVPLIAPEVTFVDSPIRSKKDFGEQVRELAAYGNSVEDIARVLERSTTEVQFVLDMGM